MGVKKFDPKQVKVIVGTHSVSGYAEGTFIECRRNEDSFNLNVGSDGQGIRIKSSNKSGQMELTLQQSSNSNQILSALALTDELTGGGTFPLTVEDLSGTSLFFAETAWIMKPADSAFGNEDNNRVWIFETDNIVMNVGGN